MVLGGSRSPCRGLSDHHRHRGLGRQFFFFDHGDLDDRHHHHTTETSTTAPPTTAPPTTAPPTTEAPTTTTTVANQVTIINLAFDPASLTVKAGDTVTWVNDDTTAHDIVADDGSFDSGNLAPGASYQFVFATAGTVPYHCSIHPQMTATVVVQ